MSYKTKLKNKHSIIPKNLRRFYNYNQNSELKVFYHLVKRKQIRPITTQIFVTFIFTKNMRSLKKVQQTQYRKHNK